MRCKIHPSDHSPGVCATCLLERLNALAAAIAKAGDGDSHSAAKPSRWRPWLSLILPGWMIHKGKTQKKKKKKNEKKRLSGRGMSPAEKQESAGDPLPVRRPGVRHYRDCRFTGLAMCFSPLFRPARARNQVPSEVGFSGEIRGGSILIGSNRSRKIADVRKLR